MTSHTGDIESGGNKYGADNLQIERWRRIVDLLDEKEPSWRKDGKCLGDYAVQAVNRALDGVTPRAVYFTVRAVGKDPRPYIAMKEQPQRFESFESARDFESFESARDFESFESARDYAMKAAGTYSHPFKVLQVLERGTADRTTPPVVWTAAP